MPGREEIPRIVVLHLLSISPFYWKKDLYVEPAGVILWIKIRFVFLLDYLVLDLAVQNGKKFLLFLNRNKRIEFIYFMTHLTKIAISGPVI